MTMTKEKAIQILSTRDAHGVLCGYTSGVTEALDMAIEALSAEAVPPSLADVYKWERDVALAQLEEYGIGFAEKKRDDLVEVVRCKDCFWFDQNIYRNCFRNRSEDEYAEWGVCTKLSHNMKVNDYCSCGEREAPYKGGDTE